MDSHNPDNSAKDDSKETIEINNEALNAQVPENFVKDDSKETPEKSNGTSSVKIAENSVEDGSKETTEKSNETPVSQVPEIPEDDSRKTIDVNNKTFIPHRPETFVKDDSKETAEINNRASNPQILESSAKDDSKETKERKDETSSTEGIETPRTYFNEVTIKLGNGTSNEVKTENAEENAEESVIPEDQDYMKTEELHKIDNEDDFKESLLPEKNKKREEIIKKQENRLSNRLEYLSRPRTDFLDRFIDEKPDGSIPENSFPSWSGLSLQTKIPLALCPIPITRKKLGTDLFLPPPANDFDLSDENNLQLPFEEYSSMHDPHAKGYVGNKQVYEHLMKQGYITESERAVCTLNDIHKYRRYQRRILAAEAQKRIRDEDEEFRRKRAEGMEQQIKRDMERYQERRKQGAMRRWIKNTVASIQESSMKNQMIRDMKVLNSQIRRRKAQRERVEATEERYQRLYTVHMKRKYDEAEETRRKAHLSLAKEDLERIDKLCKRQEDQKLQKKEKLYEFYKRKFEWQKEWIEKGLELDRIRQEEKEKNISILKRTGHLPAIRLNKTGEVDSSQRNEIRLVAQTTDEMESPEISPDNYYAGNERKDVTGSLVKEKNATKDISRESLLKSAEPEANDIYETIDAESEEEEVLEPHNKAVTESTDQDTDTY